MKRVLFVGGPLHLEEEVLLEGTEGVVHESGIPGTPMEAYLPTGYKVLRQRCPSIEVYRYENVTDDYAVRQAVQVFTAKVSPAEARTEYEMFMESIEEDI